MTDYNGFGSGTPSGLTWQNDNGAYTMGARFRVDTSGLSAIKIRWFIKSGSPSAPTTGYYVALYAVGDTTAIATAGPVNASLDAWNEQTITTSALVSGGDYIAAVLFPGGYYGADTGIMPYNPAGPINFYDGGVYNAGASLTYPGTSFGTPWYGVDVTVTDGASSATIDVAGTTGAATGSLQFASTTVAVAGTTGPATGALAFAPPISIDLGGTCGAATGALVARLTGEATETPGSWYTLLDIGRERAEWYQDERSRPSASCPNDGEPLSTGSRGELYCRYDGWRPR